MTLWGLLQDGRRDLLSNLLTQPIVLASHNKKCDRMDGGVGITRLHLLRMVKADLVGTVAGWTIPLVVKRVHPTGPATTENLRPTSDKPHEQRAEIKCRHTDSRKHLVDGKMTLFHE